MLSVTQSVSLSIKLSVSQSVCLPVCLVANQFVFLFAISSSSSSSSSSPPPPPSSSSLSLSLALALSPSFSNPPFHNSLSHFTPLPFSNSFPISHLTRNFFSGIPSFSGDCSPLPAPVPASPLPAAALAPPPPLLPTPAPPRVVLPSRLPITMQRRFLSSSQMRM